MSKKGSGHQAEQERPFKKKLISFDPNYYTLFGGVFIAVATNICVYLALDRDLERCLPLVAGGAFLIFFAGLAAMFAAWKIQERSEFEKNELRKGFSLSNQEIDNAINIKDKVLFAFLTLIISLVIGFILIAVS